MYFFGWHLILEIGQGSAWWYNCTCFLFLHWLFCRPNLLTVGMVLQPWFLREGIGRVNFMVVESTLTPSLGSTKVQKNQVSQCLLSPTSPILVVVSKCGYLAVFCVYQVYIGRGVGGFLTIYYQPAASSVLGSDNWLLFCIYVTSWWIIAK